jgi:hypothetical protein
MGGRGDLRQEPISIGYRIDAQMMLARQRARLNSAEMATRANAKRNGATVTTLLQSPPTRGIDVGAKAQINKLIDRIAEWGRHPHDQ